VSKVDDRIIAKMAAKCKALREANRLSLQEAADRIGCTKAHLWDFEQGRAANPTIRILLGMARAYNVSIRAIVGDDITPPLSIEALQIAFDVDRLLQKAASR
jgi:transcriptional regulator with XRE-family HTH domain